MGTPGFEDWETQGAVRQAPAKGLTDPFSACHPAVNLFYFLAVLFVTVFVSHPVLLACSFLGALCYAVRLNGFFRVVKFNLVFTLPAMLIVAFINPAFNHYGVTFLFYLKTGPVTLEAIVYGAVLASTLFISILWFSCYNKVMTTDKFVYLFGRVIPALSLVLSMVLRFVPRFTRELGVIRDGQKCVGRDISNAGLIRKVKYAVTLLSILVTWALENAVETSDSMRARGYGLKGRTAFSIFRFDSRDGLVCLSMAALLALFGLGAASGAASALYNPMIVIGGFPPTPRGVASYAAWAAFCFLPVLLGILEDGRFKVLEAKMRTDRKLPWYLTDPGRKE